MTCQSLLSMKSKKNMISLLSAKSAHCLVKVEAPFEIIANDIF